MLLPFSLTLLPPIAVALWYKENTIPIFLSSFLATGLAGFFLWLPFRTQQREIHIREGFLIVSLLWIVFPLLGALPFILFSSTFVDAFFETISGLTTTGSTVFTNLQVLPRSLLYYRQQLQFVGGVGIIVLGIAILPMLSVGGMQLFRAEMTGPFKEEKLTPRVAQTAKTLWFIYVGLVLLCALSYWGAGLSLFDAIGYSFSTVSTGGFGTHDKSFGLFNNPTLEILGVIFMILGALNFSLHFVVVRRGTLRHYWQDQECRTFLIFWGTMVVIVSTMLIYYHVFENAGQGILKGLFQVTSIFTTTGLYSTSIDNWPTFVPILLMFLAILGGCSGSTAGGIKMIRFVILKMQGVREIQRLIHPNAHYVIKLGQNKLHHSTLDALWGFFCIYVATFVVLLLFLLATGLDLLTAFSALAASISNTGVGLGVVSDNFKAISDSAKIILSAAMLLGRLELFTFFVLLAPSYWRN